ncbi:MAG: succinate dehydrogenase cytochrome b subunit [Acidobacteria bacterium]|nr:succinate dehydrogenase cytochrome b subunit [Acidobacteriota bacterium]
MSAIAISRVNRTTLFYQTPVGKKVVMAVTGVMLFGYLIAHLIGNLQIFTGNAAAINAYAEFLHSKPGMLWVARSVLLLAVLLHIVSSVQLWLLKRAARPISYYKKEDTGSNYAARTMIWSGPIIASFVVFHVLHLTVGDVVPLKTTPEGTLDVYHNVIAGFQNPVISGFYIVAMVLLCLHLFHGLWSMFQSVGVSHPRYTPCLKKFAAVFAFIIAIGNISIPVAVMIGIIK